MLAPGPHALGSCAGDGMRVLDDAVAGRQASPSMASSAPGLLPEPLVTTLDVLGQLLSD